MAYSITVSECPACGASLPARKKYSLCPACGSPLPEEPGYQRGVPSRRQAELDDLLGRMNERLVDTGAEISDRAFNLGCGLGFLLLLAWGVAIYFIGGRNWLLLLISLVIFSLAVLWLVVLISDLSRNRALARVYRDEVKPELEKFERSGGVGAAEIEFRAHSLLPDQAPLLRFMPAPTLIEEEVQHTGP